MEETILLPWPLILIFLPSYVSTSSSGLIGFALRVSRFRRWTVMFRLVIPWLLNIHHLSSSLSLWPSFILAKFLLLRVSVIALLLLRVLVFQPLAVVVV